ncbi:rhamnogalacturonate lyase [Hortaea werneckii]|nr:rhamnogalacturonate lyase [Hortaea werneckii]KAI7024895.1 rhamnogalacturonate lyase [Hortaea werneckii]KAI7673901.1 rhamnogalacturonate lyase [Hortaea werneckii]
MPQQPITVHGLQAAQLHEKVDLLIENLVNIKDTTGKFLLRLEDGRVIDTKGWNDWEWTHGIGLYGLWQYHFLTGSEKALKTATGWFREQLAIGTTKNINTMSPFLTLAYLHERTGEPSYLPWLDSWAEWAMYDLSRTPFGGMQHVTYAADNTNELWDDTLMMTVLPLAKIGKLLNRPHYIEEAKRQFLLHIKYLFDPTTGLFFHGWKFDNSAEGGFGHNFARARWARGNSWLTIVIPDFIELLDLPANDGLRIHLIDTLEAQCQALKRLQAKNGMWRTILDKPQSEGSYEEASATAGFAYGMLKAARKRYIDRSYEDVALKAVKAVMERISDDGELREVSFGTGMGSDLQHYYDIPLTTNDRLYASVNKATGAIDLLALDGQNLLGPDEFQKPTADDPSGSNQNGFGPYLDCYCTPEGFYRPGSYEPEYTLLSGNDSSGEPWGGVVLSEVYPSTGQRLEQYWFLRESETGLHMFSRVAYYNETTPFLRNLQELRTLFRPSSPLWTHLSTNEQHDTWQDHKVHGFFGDGTYSDDGSTYGAWLVMNTIDTYFGGPLHSDLTVDGIVYNYISSNHHGNQVPNITDGFDRTFGPQYYHFNKGSSAATLQDLRQDALQYASPTWNVDFYDSIAPHVPNYVPSSERGSWEGKIKLPHGAGHPIAVLSQNGVDFQDNVFDTEAYQYWADVDEHTGKVEIPRVKADTYRLTVYAEGIFGQYVQDDVVVEAGKTSKTKVHWKEESAGKELWRIGTPDKSSGEYRHGYERDPTHPLHPEEYRIYWGAYDYHEDFPEGVTFRVGESDVGDDLNYIHWSVYGGKGSLREDPYCGDGDVNNWTVLFDVSKHALHKKSEATLTVQLSGAKTAAGNTDVFNASEPYIDLPYTVVINGYEQPSWIIPWNQSSSCGVRSAVICYNIAHKFTFDAGLLQSGENELILSLPYNATDYESALLPTSTYVQYDALRLEVK